MYGPVVDSTPALCPNETRLTESGTTFRLLTNNGNIEVQSQWKSFPQCPTCPAKADAIIQQALQKARARNEGKLTATTVIIPKTEKQYGPAGKVTYRELTLQEFLEYAAKTYNSFLENLKVPPPMWEEGGDYPVRDETAVISGAIDQGLEEVRDIPDMLGLGLTLLADPDGAADQLGSFAQDLNWQKASELGKEVLKGSVFADEFEKGGKPALHATGRAAVVIGTFVATGGAGLLATVRSAPDAVRKKLDDILALLNKLAAKLRKPELRDVLEKDLYDDNFKNLLEQDNDLVEAWEVLESGQRPKLKLTKEALEKVKELLADASVRRAFGTNYADELAKVCQAQGGFTGAKSLIEHLDDVMTFCRKFEGKEGFDLVIASMKNTGSNAQDGLQHVLTQINKQDFDAPSVKRFDMEFEGEGLPCTKCRFDVERTPTASDPTRLIEYKSYSDASKIQLPQFLNYISSVQDLSEMKYIFNQAKLTTEQAKNGMAIFVKNNNQEIVRILPASVKSELLLITSSTTPSDSQIQAIVSKIVESK